MPNYDDLLFSPPAPVANVTLRDPASSALLSEIPMLLDYGADVTVIPQSVLALNHVVILLDEPQLTWEMQ